MSIDGVSAILLISEDAEKLAGFYRDALGIPLDEELHEGVALHYACNLGGVHFAIHPSGGWPGTPTAEALSPVIALRTSDATSVAERLQARGVTVTGPHDHGFAQVLSFRDPEGHHAEVLEPTSD